MTACAVATWIWIALTVVTIKVQWANGRKAELELEILRRKLAED